MPEVKGQVELTLSEQLVSLGLGGLVNCPVAAGPHKDRRQLQQRLERAERRRKREEETLRRLQETAALLAQCLGDSSPGSQAAASHLSLLTSRPPDLDLTEDGGHHAYSAADRHGQNSARGESLADPPSHGLHADDCAPAMSHRDRVLARKERRREEEQQKFEEEARKIREENIAYQ